MNLNLTMRGDFLVLTGEQAHWAAGILGLVVTKDRYTGEAEVGLPVYTWAEQAADLMNAGAGHIDIQMHSASVSHLPSAKRRIGK